MTYLHVAAVHKQEAILKLLVHKYKVNTSLKTIKIILSQEEKGEPKGPTALELYPQLQSILDRSLEITVLGPPMFKILQERAAANSFANVTIQFA